MRKLIPLLLALCAAFAAEQAKLPSPSVEDKLALREAQLSLQQEQLSLMDLANKILQANITFAEKQKAVQRSQSDLAAKHEEVSAKLRKQSGCKDCVLNDQLEFVPPEKPSTPPAK